jgi:hypothetical protein
MPPPVMPLLPLLLAALVMLSCDLLVLDAREARRATFIREDGDTPDTTADMDEDKDTGDDVDWGVCGLDLGDCVSDDGVRDAEGLRTPLPD